MGKQHYLSQLYLRGFSFDEKNIFCYSRDDSVFYSSLNSSNESIKIKDCGCKEKDFWNIEMEEKITLIETDLGQGIKDFRKTNDISKLCHEKLIRFVMMQLIRSQIAGDDSYNFIKEEIVVIRKEIKAELGDDILEADIRSIILNYFFDRIFDDFDTIGFGSIMNRKMYLSKISGERQFITTKFPFIHDGENIYFPLTSKWIIFITTEQHPVIELDTSIDFNNFRVELFNRQFVNSHTDNRYIFGRKEDIQEMISK